MELWMVPKMKSAGDKNLFHNKLLQNPSVPPSGKIATSVRPIYSLVISPMKGKTNSKVPQHFSLSKLEGNSQNQH